jgi:hypothetical protein
MAGILGVMGERPGLRGSFKFLVCNLMTDRRLIEAPKPQFLCYFFPALEKV